MKKALTIAGSDSGGGAGIQADLKTFEHLGIYGMSAITAVTAQNTLGVAAIHHLPAPMVAQQIEAVMSDIGADAIKIGMLGNAAIAEAVAGRLRSYPGKSIVLDPVMVATSNDSLLERNAIATVKEQLFPLATLVTPNKFEAELLANLTITDLETAQAAAKRIYQLGPQAVLLTGGHLAEELATDIFYDGQQLHQFSRPRLSAQNTHGTGCTLAAAIAGYLALGLPLIEAVNRGKDYVWERLNEAQQHHIGAGSGPICLPH